MLLIWVPSRCLLPVLEIVIVDGFFIFEVRRDDFSSSSSLMMVDCFDLLLSARQWAIFFSFAYLSAISLSDATFSTVSFSYKNLVAFSVSLRIKLYFFL